MTERKKISIVIPCYRSAKTIGDVVQNIHQTLFENSEFDYEVILVNDGSPDDTAAVLRVLAQSSSHVIALDLAKNFGQHSALMAGYAQVTGDYILGLDDDGEHDPSQMFALIRKLEEGYDYVCAQFGHRENHTLMQNLGSRANNWMATWLLGKPEDVSFSSYYIMRRFVVDEIIKCKNPYPYVGGILMSVTHNIASVEMEHKPRAAGVSGYSLKKSLALWVNGFTAFSVKPLRIATVLGTIVACGGFLYGLAIVIRKLLTPSFLVGYASTMAVLLLIGGMLMLMLGLVGEYVGRIYISLNQMPQYVVKDVYKSDNNGTP